MIFLFGWGCALNNKVERVLVVKLEEHLSLAIAIGWATETEFSVEGVDLLLSDDEGETFGTNIDAIVESLGIQDKIRQMAATVLADDPKNSIIREPTCKNNDLH